MMSAIESESQGETAYRRIRADILFGRLAPSRKLKLELLRSEYQTSVSTLREILSRLASEKLVVSEGQRGFEVAPISVTNLKEIAGLRQLLEKHALTQSFAQGDIEWEAHVVAAHYKLATAEKQMLTGNAQVSEQWKQYDWQFHQALVSACGSRLLMETHAAVFEKYLRYQMLTLGFRGEIAVEEHQELLDCALRRDAASAQVILMKHVEGGLKHALAADIIG